MGFISMAIVSILFFILLIGLVLFIIGLVLDITWIATRKKKKVKGVHKAFAILLTILGICLFVLPIGFISFAAIMGRMEKQHTINQFENKVYMESKSYDMFPLNGVNYTKIDFLHGSYSDGEEVCILIFPDDSTKTVYKVENELDADILYMENVGLFVPEPDYMMIKDYYENKAPLDITISYYDDSDVSKKFNTDFSKEMLNDIHNVYDTVKDISYNNDDIIERFYISGYSSDKLYYNHIYIELITGNQLVLSHTASGEKTEGHTLSDSYEEYVRDQIKQWTDYPIE